MFKIKKYFILCLSVLFAINPAQYASGSEASDQDNLKQTDGQILQDNNYQNNKLISNSDWKKLKKLWKELNHFKDKGFLASSKFFQQKDADFKTAFKGLVDANLLTNSEKAFFEKLFNDRLDYLKHTSYQSACYQLCDSFETIIKTRHNLENRYDALEKLFKQNKLTSDAYKVAKENIIKDLQYLNKETAYSTFKNPVETNDDNVNLLIELNK